MKHSIPKHGGRVEAVTTVFPPKAWMGYGQPIDGVPVARVCSYCPDKKQADEEAASAGHLVTHGCCETCFQIQLSTLT